MIIYGIKRCGYETPKWTIPANTTLTFTKQTHLYLLLTQAAADGTVTITGSQKAPSVVSDVNNYTTEADGSRIYTNPLIKTYPVESSRLTADMFCRERGFFQSSILESVAHSSILSTGKIIQSTPYNTAWTITPLSQIMEWSTVPNGSKIVRLKCSITQSQLAQGIKIYTNTIPIFGGKYVGTNDDYRGGGAAGMPTLRPITILCGQLGLIPFNNGEIANINYKCNDGAAPTRHFHNGGAWDNNGGGGAGWCESTSVEWVLCKPTDIILPPTPVTVPVGACCPAGLKWSSVQNKCV